MTWKCDVRPRRPLWVGLCAAALLVGCASRVPLDTPAPVEDRRVDGTPAQPAPSQGARDGLERSGPLAQARAAFAQLPSVVYFDLDSDVLRADSRPVIESHARLLRSQPLLTLRLTGHTDERGGRAYNLALGQRRAQAVLRALTVLGVAEDRLEAVSLGQEQPAVTGEGEAVWSQNRRVELSAP